MHPIADTQKGFPHFTIIICGKRHKTMFYLTTEQGCHRSGNTKPGTVVDHGIYAKAILSPFQDIADVVEDLTHSKCYLFGRATKAVKSVPASVLGAFLYGEDGETFEQESHRLLDADLIEDDLRHWRYRGPVGRLRNIIKFIRASPQRSERFQTLASEADDHTWLIQESSRELQLILSNETRWNSTYLMIERALRKQGHLQTFLIENQMEEDASKRLPAEDVLHPEDWRLLVELKEIRHVINQLI
ncbi:transposase-like protein [Purpureocillium lavendulum]|uniref:Transposase-like protein n=1 Tax=Purpureocillium lavendulum TaxID=1247861 RepID=A0AB34FL40_9HYPO|nr:transposase-like protein [Purpureocillium lavendulum]